MAEDLLLTACPVVEFFLGGITLFVDLFLLLKAVIQCYIRKFDDLTIFAIECQIYSFNDYVSTLYFLIFVRIWSFLIRWYLFKVH